MMEGAIKCKFIHGNYTWQKRILYTEQSGKNRTDREKKILSQVKSLL
jgi:hypothetical protein